MIERLRVRWRMPTWRARLLLAGSAILAAGCGASDFADSTDSPAPREYSTLAEDESLQFFRTAAWLDSESQTWRLPLHGWVYEPEDSRFRLDAARRILREKFGLDPDGAAAAIFERRFNWLIADNERDKVIHVRIGDRDFRMPATDAHGKFEATVSLAVAEAQRLAVDGRISFSAATKGAASRLFRGSVTLVPPTGVSVISDIDDTVKISMVTDRRKLLEYALLREFEPAPGMPGLYAGWAGAGAAVHYVSSSPWQLYPELEAFVDDVGLPAASFSLKRVRFRDETLFDLFAKGEETKPAQIEPILHRWPGRRFVLVGDSGEQDPEVYARLLRRYPGQIAHVYIRNVTGATPNDERFVSLFAGFDSARWQLFEDTGSLAFPAAIDRVPGTTAQ